MAGDTAMALYLSVQTFAVVALSLGFHETTGEWPPLLGLPGVALFAAAGVVLLGLHVLPPAGGTADA